MANTEHTITVSNLEVLVVRKSIRNLHLAVYPPGGRVRVAVPERVSDESVRLFVLARLGWIRKQQQRFENQERLAPREFTGRESHYFRGQRYLLRLHETSARPQVRITTKTYIDLYMPPGSTAAQREQVLDAWYRQSLKTELPALLEKWEKRMGVKLNRYTVRKMKTRWGSCNAEQKHMLINSQLAQKPLHCLEFIIVHELVHLFERRHNERFYELMTHYLPHWPTLRDELNRLPLAYGGWEY